ncbi:hypothetical protein [Acanthopleuribacter pedis]|uniref:Uncharacterized protein n=1 Tax=Acanthopleuribacter pedis TaxID=442870 RepID=A0A8J7QFN8_9BACT|nr:hypothetical protein [Acanthopleuribacter pedis]MBO1319070.1 hypothetical protein [Acanthopleuribacter pedis]
MGKNKGAAKGGCFMMSGWFVLAAALFVLLVFAAIATLYQLGVWDEFWAELF